MNTRLRKTLGTELLNERPGQHRATTQGKRNPLQAMTDGSQHGQQLRERQQLADTSRQVRKLMQLKESIDNRKPHSGSTKTVQLLTSGELFTRPLLSVKTEQATRLKQWKNGEFFAWNTSDAYKDHFHAHIYNPAVTADSATVEGHVVTAKGPGNTRNQTKYTIRGRKDAENAWTISSDAGEKQTNVPNGSPEVSKASHTVEASTLWLDMRKAVRETLTMSDADAGIATGQAQVREAALVRENARLQREQEERERAAAGAIPDADDDTYDLSLLNN